MAEETKVIRIVIDSSRAVDGSAAATRALERMERSTGSVASSMDSLERMTRNLLGGYLGTQGVRAIISAADAFTKFENAIRTAGTSAGEMAAVSDRLFSAANRNGVDIGALSTLYSRASMAAGELGASQDKLLKFVDGVTAGLRLQGGSTEAASGALLQLGTVGGAKDRLQMTNVDVWGPDVSDREGDTDHTVTLNFMARRSNADAAVAVFTRNAA